MKLNSVSVSMTTTDCLDMVLMLQESTYNTFSVIRPLTYHQDGMFQIKDNLNGKVFSFSNKDMPIYLEKLFKVSLIDFIGMADKNHHDSINSVNMCQVMCYGKLVYA